MNRKQKIITTVALVVFVLVTLFFMQSDYHPLVLHYYTRRGGGSSYINPELTTLWVMIGVVYAALFFMFKEKKPPQLKQKLEPTTYSPTHHFPQAPQKDGDDDKRLAEMHLALSEEAWKGQRIATETGQMRSDQEIENEIAALKLALKDPRVYRNSQARWTIPESIKVLELRMSAEEIKREYYPPPSDDYQDGDNVMFIDQMRVHAWMTGQEGYTAPSKNLKSL